MKPKILIISGTRPDTIKLAPLIIKLRKNPNFETMFITTGQHKELLKQALEAFKLKEDINFSIMRENQELYQTTMLLLDKLNTTIKLLKPNIIITQGDTLTAFATTLAGFYNQIQIMHIEAGLRTYDLKNPFPEEGFRQKIDRVSQHLMPPTQHAKTNLTNENLTQAKIYVTGNTIVDAINLITPKTPLYFENPYLNNITFSKKILFLTAHRRENFGQPNKNIFEIILKITNTFKNIEVIYPTHPNPNVNFLAQKILANKKFIHLIEPLSYIDTLKVLQKCYFVISDSGGIQEEAPAFNKKVLVTRKITERPEGISAGFLEVVGTKPETIFNAAKKYITKPYPLTNVRNPFGDGFATERIISYLEKHFGFRKVLLPEFIA